MYIFYSNVLISANFVSAGLPEADVTWFRNKSRLHHVPHHSDASLFLANITYTDQGLYACKAANIHGEVSESTQLQVIGIYNFSRKDFFCIILPANC